MTERFGCVKLLVEFVNIIYVNEQNELVLKVMNKKILDSELLLLTYYLLVTDRYALQTQRQNHCIL